MKMTGYDENDRPVRLPDSIDEYYSGAAKRFAHITGVIFVLEKFEASGGVLRGDFGLLRAFLADHDRRITVRICKDEVSFSESVVLFFPDFLYGFVEDTFARAIHHKIEGSGYACRECVGKHEIRLREYDRLFGRVADDDMVAAFEMGFGRLLYPTDLAESSKALMEAFMKENDRRLLEFLAGKTDACEEKAEYLTRHELLNREHITEALPIFSDTSHAQTVAVLLAYVNKNRKRKRFVL